MYRGAGNAWYPPQPTQDDDSPTTTSNGGAAPPPLHYPGEAPPPGHHYDQHDMQYAYYDQGYDPQLYYTPQQYGAPAPDSSFPPQRDDPPSFATASSHLPVPPAAAGYEHYSTVQYAHDRMYSAVESARWTGEFDSSPAALQQHHHHHSTTTTTTTTSSSHSALGSYAHAHASQSGSGSDEAARRRSVASSTDSGDSPRVGALGLPIEDDPSLPPPEIKPFVQKLFSMLSDPEHYQDVILWNHAGDAFFVAHNDRFINEVLPNAFGHSNVHSFTRQLNVYNFQRMNVAQLRSALDLQGGIAGAYSGWSHPQFRRGDASTLAHLTPRPSRARLIRKLEKQYGGSTTSTSAGSAGSASASASSGGSSASPSMRPISPRSSQTTRLAKPPTHTPHHQQQQQHHQQQHHQQQQHHPHQRPQVPISHPHARPDPPYP
ncbi:hypothetical protein JCM8208_005501 [Rhodotorula glutinis]